MTDITFELCKDNDPTYVQRLFEVFHQERLEDKCMWKEGTVLNHKRFAWIIRKEDKDVGYILLTPILPKICVIHIACLKVIYGHTEEMGRKFFKTALTDFKKPIQIMAYIPQRNILAVRLAKRLGFKVLEVVEDFLEISAISDGRLQRLYILSKTVE